VHGYIVKFDSPYPKRETPQCINCQGYSHTTGFCNWKARCIKCARNHSTFSCPRKVKSKNVKCVLCEYNRPINYKGCEDLQERHFPTLRKKEITTKPQIQIKPVCIQSGTVQPGKTYASVTRLESSRSTENQIYRATKEGSASKPRSVHTKSHARIPERI